MASRRPSDPTSSVELTVNAKGDVQMKVDVNDVDPYAAAKTAGDILDILRAKYPRENGA